MSAVIVGPIEERIKDLHFYIHPSTFKSFGLIIDDTLFLIQTHIQNTLTNNSLSQAKNNAHKNANKTENAMPATRGPIGCVRATPAVKVVLLATMESSFPLHSASS